MPRFAVVGGSLAGLEAAKSLRACGHTGEIVVIGSEGAEPYDRPPLSKELLTGAYTAADLRLDCTAAVGVEWRLGRPATGLDAAERSVTANGAAERFDGIVIATAAAPVWPAGLAAARTMAGVHTVRSLDDSLALAAELARSPRRMLVVGGGFIDAEVASSTRALGLPVTVVESAALPMLGAVGAEVAGTLAAVMRAHGVDLRTGVSVEEILGGDRVERAVLSDGSVVAADVVVVAVGVRPNTGWLHGSGLTLDQGVVCDHTGLAAPGIVAAGDVARIPLPRYGEHRRVEHWDNAIRQARHVAATLVGQPALYDPVPWFWTDQFGAKVQLLGSVRGYDGFRVVQGALDEGTFLGLYRRGSRAVAAVSRNANRAMLTCRRVLERDLDWDDALAAVGDRGATGPPDPRPTAGPPGGTDRVKDAR